MQKTKNLLLITLASTLILVSSSCSRKSHMGCPGNFGKVQQENVQKDV